MKRFVLAVALMAIMGCGDERLQARIDAANYCEAVEECECDEPLEPMACVDGACVWPDRR